MRVLRRYVSKQTAPDLLLNIRSNSDPEPEFSGNDFTYLKEFHDAITKTKALWRREIHGSRMLLQSKGGPYWPSSEISLQEVHEGTLVTIRYKMAKRLIAGYVCMSLLILSVIFSELLDPDMLDKTLIFPLLAFILLTILFFFLFRWLQNNIIIVIENR